MKTILLSLLTVLGNSLSKVICAVCEAVKSFFQYKKANIQNKIEERQQKKEEEFEKKVDEVSKDGTIEDLLNLKR